jgi:hypothetical protein
MGSDWRYFFIVALRVFSHMKNGIVGSSGGNGKLNGLRLRLCLVDSAVKRGVKRVCADEPDIKVYICWDDAVVDGVDGVDGVGGGGRSAAVAIFKKGG